MLLSQLYATIIAETIKDHNYEHPTHDQNFSGAAGNVFARLICSLTGENDSCSLNGIATSQCYLP